ncbi:MAG: hypothetical protein M2R45_00363 [Verrucomicrobia subdivision 3 bacterium]|nr:hypothetical protein [Limisphaerales bacterium]MCS1412879.1 hypothetical protein [Limisphaerales bacterium]
MIPFTSPTETGWQGFPKQVPNPYRDFFRDPDQEQSTYVLLVSRDGNWNGRSRWNSFPTNTSIRCATWREGKRHTVKPFNATFKSPHSLIPTVRTTPPFVRFCGCCWRMATALMILKASSRCWPFTSWKPMQFVIVTRNWVFSRRKRLKRGCGKGAPSSTRSKAKRGGGAHSRHTGHHRPGVA